MGLGLEADGYFHPASEDELAGLVARAYADGLKLRVCGSLHAMPAEISLFKQLPGSSLKHINVSLDRYRNFKWIDEVKGICQVEAGCVLSSNPWAIGGPTPLSEGLCPQMDKCGWALNDLGGISRQTVSGFMATGSAGGSCKYDLDDNILALRVIDGTGRIRNLQRGTDEFNATRVSMGLLGVISTVTIQGVPRYAIKGQETTTTYEDCKIDLFGPGSADRPSLEKFMHDTDYMRFYWYPQKGLERIVLWEASRIPMDEDFVPKPYVENGTESKAEQVLAGLLYAIVGNLSDLRRLPTKLSAPVRRGLAGFTFWEDAESAPSEFLQKKIGLCKPLADALGEILAWLIKAIVDTSLELPGIQVLAHIVQAHLDELLEKLYPAFVPLSSESNPPQQFQDVWWKGLPMDNDTSDVLLPTAFSELWFPASSTQAVMKTLKDWLEEGGLERSGTFNMEVYGATGSQSWLGQSSAWPGMKEPEPVLRVDCYWYCYNNTSPYEFYELYWNVLKPFNFKLHWGKYTPNDLGPNYPWAKYYSQQYPKWDEFHSLRKRKDPKDIFLSSYWSNRLGISMDGEDKTWELNPEGLVPTPQGPSSANSSFASIKCRVWCYSCVTILMCMFVTLSIHAPFLESIRDVVKHTSMSRGERAKLDTLLAVDLITSPVLVYLLGVALYGLAIQRKLCSRNIAYMLVLVAFGTVAEIVILPLECTLLRDSANHYAFAWQQWLIILGGAASQFLACGLGIALSMHMFTALLAQSSSEGPASSSDKSIEQASFPLGTFRAGLPGLPRLGLCQRRSPSTTKGDGYEQLLPGGDVELV
jgi:D-arabinono-1,4-lactone oxidase